MTSNAPAGLVGTQLCALRLLGEHINGLAVRHLYVCTVHPDAHMETTHLTTTFVSQLLPPETSKPNNKQCRLLPNT